MPTRPPGPPEGHSAVLPHPRRYGNQNHPSKCRCPAPGGCGRPLPVALRIGPGSSCESPWGGLQLRE